MKRNAEDSEALAEELRALASQGEAQAVVQEAHTVDCAIALEQSRALQIVAAVARLPGRMIEGPYQAGFESACEEIEYRLRHEEWSLGGVAAPLPERCPRPANDRPDDFTIAECQAAGECGCTAPHSEAQAGETPSVIERLQQQYDIRGDHSPFGALARDALRELNAANERADVAIKDIDLEQAIAVQQQRLAERLKAENDALRAQLAAQQAQAVDITQIIRDVAELPDRNSPEDQPELMLVSAEELRAIIERNSEQQPQDAEQLRNMLASIRAVVPLASWFAQKELDRIDAALQAGDVA